MEREDGVVILYIIYNELQKIWRDLMVFFPFRNMKEQNAEKSKTG